MTALLAIRGLGDLDRQRVLEMFRSQNAGPEVRYSAGGVDTFVTGNGNEPITAEHESGAFIAVAGVPLYRREIGRNAASRMLSDFVADDLDEEQLGGAFAAVLWNGEQLIWFTDWFGNLCAYADDQGTVWSTSFLTTVAGRNRHTIDRQGAWEYIFLGASYGESTVLRGIRRLDPEKWYSVDSGAALVRKNLLPRAAIDDLTFDAAVHRAVAALSGVFDVIANHYGDRIDTALSGGYDSRLILAALRGRGIRPRVHVYGRPGDPDVVIAKAIAAGEGFDLCHSDKTLLIPPQTRDATATAIQRNFVAFDGLPLDGIFDDGADLLTRQNRMADGYLALNGGGGEIFRNFFYFLDRSVSLDDLLASFFSTYDRRACPRDFNASEYVNALGQKIANVLKIDPRDFARLDVERAYPLFRCRFWMARTTSINNQLGAALTPLVHVPAVATALRVPIRYKTHGRLEAAMIKRLDSNLSEYPSNYRDSLSQPPTATERLQDYFSLARPIWLRKLARRMKREMQNSNACSAWLTKYGEHIGAEVKDFDDLIVLDKLRDVAELRRAATLKFLCMRLDVSNS